MEGREKSTEEASHSRQVGGKSNQQANLHASLIYIETLMGFSHISCPDGLRIASLSQSCILGAALGMGKASRIIPRTEEGGGGLQLPPCSSRVNGWSWPLKDISHWTENLETDIYREANIFGSSFPKHLFIAIVFHILPKVVAGSYIWQQRKFSRKSDLSFL